MRNFLVGRYRTRTSLRLAENIHSEPPKTTGLPLAFQRSIAHSALIARGGPGAGHSVHELATKFAKYGATSTDNSRVSIRWDRRLNGRPSNLVLEWGSWWPRVDAPGKSSYGASTIHNLIPYEFAGRCREL